MELISDPLETLVSKITAGLAILLAIILLMVLLSGRRRPSGVPDAPDDRSDGSVNDLGDVDGGGEPNAFIAEPSGSSSEGTEPGDVGEIFTDGFESGDTSAWSDNHD